MTTDIQDRIRDVVGEAGLITDPALLAGYLQDERGLYKGHAAFMAKPESTAQVAAIMAICYEAGVAMVPQGGNTGYCGGATPDGSGSQVLINMSRLNRIRKIDAVGFTMTVEAGCVLADVQSAAADADRFFPLSMGSEGNCQIGGNLATNAGGLAVVRYGTCRELTLGLEVVLPGGTVLHDLKGLRKDNSGYDLKALFIGAEGTLGIITAAVIKLFASPRDVQTAFLAVTDVEAACRLLGLARCESGENVTSFEYISGAALDLVAQNVVAATPPFAERHNHYVLLELGSAAAPGSMTTVMETVLRAGMGSGDIIDGVIAQSGKQQRRLWQLRESIPEAEKQEGGSIKHDISVIIPRIPEFMQRAAEAVARVVPEARLSSYGHIGDGNIHFNVLPPAGERDAAFKKRNAAAVSGALHELVAGMAGSFSAEHGIGQLKRATLARYKDPAALAVMKAIKQALDPKGLMNPGKVIAAGNASG